MSSNCRAWIAAVLFLVTAAAASAQVKLGTPTFGSFSGGADVVDLANLNVHVPLPITNKPGRGLPFAYSLGYDSSIWTPYNSSGTAVWTPAANWGFTTGLPAWNGIVSYTDGSGCAYYPPYYEACWTSWSNFVYTDASGTRHPAPSLAYYSYNGSGGWTGSGLAADGSGYTIEGTNVVFDRSGNIIFTASGGGLGTAGSIEDSNGDYISANASGTNIVITDTLGQSPLTITSSNTLTIPTGTVTLYYQNYTVRTHFGCSGIAEFGPTTKSLLYMIKMPDGSAYTFQYEPTSGYSGDVTGRVSSVSLTTGETISYTYTGTSCTDGSTTGLTRTTPDGTWTYARNGGTTTVTAPKLSYDSAGNQTVYTFDSNGHETQRKIYQGSATLLRTINTTWDSNDIAPTKTVTILEDNSTQSEVDTSYDSYGNLTSKTVYDWGSGGHGSLLTATTYTYSSNYGGIANLLTEETIADASGTTRYRKDIGYDQSAIVNCPTGVLQHDDTYHGCSFTMRGNPTTVTTYTNPAGGSGAISKIFTYDVFGNEISAQLNCCQQKTWSYSATTNYAFPDSITSALSPSLTTHYAYNLSTGVVTSVTDPNGLVTNYGYDPTTGLLSSISYPDGHSVSLGVNYGGSGCFNGQCYTWPTTRTVTSELTSSEWVYSTTYLDGMGRPSGVSTSDSRTYYSTSSFGYDALGRQWETSNPCAGYQCSPANWTKTQFDALGRPTLTILPDNEQTSYNYSLEALTIADPTGKKREAFADALGRLIETVEDPGGLGYVTSYSHDVLGDVTQVSQGQQTRTYTYDGIGQLTSAAIPEANGAASTYTYDSFDNLTSRSDPRGVVTNYTYDGLNRLTGISYSIPQGSGVSAMPNDCDPTNPDGTNYTANACFYYDQGGASAYALGQLTEMKDSTGLESYTYDNMGRKTQLNKVIGSATYTTSYQYNYAGEITQITYPSGHVVNPSYDTIGRLASMTGNLSGTNVTYASGFAYDAADHVTQFEYGNGIYGSFGFSPDRLQLTCLDYSTTNRNGTCAHDSTSILGLDYGYTQNGGNDGQITSIGQYSPIGHPTTDYSYDALSRIIDAAFFFPNNYIYPPDWELQWSYDRYGNRTAQTVAYGTGPSNSVAVDPTTNRIISQGYAYDLNGNMTNDGQNTLVYDGENRVSSGSGNLGSGTYVYDGSGLRVEKTSGGTTTVYIYSGSKVIAEYDSGAAPANPSREYVYSGSVLLAKSEGGAMQYYHQDHLSVRVITDASGSIIGQQAHYPYGEQMSSSGTSTKWAFTGYERDSESDNDYAMAREYLNRLGRFNTLDTADTSPSDPQSLNRYSYAENDPINNVDPSGQDVYVDGVDWSIGIPWMAPNFGQWDEFEIMQIPVVVGTLYTFWTPDGGNFNFSNFSLGDLIQMAQGPDAELAMTSTPILGGALVLGLPPAQTAVYTGPYTDRLQQLRTALAKDQDCLNFLGSKGLDPLQVLDAVIDNNKVGTVLMPPTVNGDGSVSITNAQTGYPGTGLAIAVNALGAYFHSSFTTNRGRIPGGTPAAQGFILLHELGHLTNATVPDNNKQKLVDKNDKDISKHCKRTISSF